MYLSYYVFIFLLFYVNSVLKSLLLVPLTKHKMLLYIYEEEIEQILSGSINHRNF